MTAHQRPVTRRAPDTFRRRASHRRVLSGRDGAARTLTLDQIEAVRAVMRLFSEDDTANGVRPERMLYCEACEQARPMAGFIQYERLAFCNDCAIEYELARLRGLGGTPGQFVRDKRFGDGDNYSLRLALLEAAPSGASDA